MESSDAVGTFWSHYESQSVGAGDTWILELEPADDDYWYKIDHIAIVTTGDHPLSVIADMNGEIFAHGYDDRQLMFRLSDNPTIEIGYNDKMTVAITNQDSSAHTMSIAMYGLKRYMPGGYVKIPMAKLEGDPIVGNIPLSVAFTDLSKRFPTSWVWDFGDGSELVFTQNPVHIYDSLGIYTVKLTAGNAAGHDIIEYVDYIIATISEILSTYTEVDPGDHIVINATKATITNMPRSGSYYLYKDFGVDNFNAIDIHATCLITSTSQNYGEFSVVTITNTLADLGSIPSPAVSVVVHKNSSGEYVIVLMRGHNTAHVDSIVLSADTPYYVTLQRAASSDTCYCYIYSDAARTVLVDTLSLSGFGTGSFRYVMTCLNVNYAPTANVSGYVDDIIVL
jgi:PKD repeat protein